LKCKTSHPDLPDAWNQFSPTFDNLISEPSNLTYFRTLFLEKDFNNGWQNALGGGAETIET